MRALRGRVLVTLCLVLASLGLPATASAKDYEFWLPWRPYGIGLHGYRGFWDVDGDEWFATEELLGYALDHSLMGGYGGNDFGPGDSVTRGQVVTVLWRVAGEPPAVVPSFDDVAVGDYYSLAVSWARSEGIATGYEGTNLFGPNDPVTREQLAKFAYGLASWMGASVSSVEELDAFIDAGSISEWAVPCVSWCLAEGVLTGSVTPEGPRANPQAAATRGEFSKVATVLHRDVLGLGGSAALEGQRQAALASNPASWSAGQGTVVLTGVVRRTLSFSAELGRPLPVYYVELPREIAVSDSSLGTIRGTKLLLEGEYSRWGGYEGLYGRLGKTVTVSTTLSIRPDAFVEERVVSLLWCNADLVPTRTYSL